MKKILVVLVVITMAVVSNAQSYTIVAMKLNNVDVEVVGKIKKINNKIYFTITNKKAPATEKLTFEIKGEPYPSKDSDGTQFSYFRGILDYNEAKLFCIVGEHPNGITSFCLTYNIRPSGVVFTILTIKD